MKWFRKLFGLYTEKELVDFGNFLLENRDISNETKRMVWDSDLANWKYEVEN